MKILFLTAGPQILASSRTRVYQYLPCLKQEGIGFKVINFNSYNACRSMLDKTGTSSGRKLLNKVYSFLGILRFLLLARSYSVVFIQKVLLPGFILDILSFLNDNIIFDFDDAIFTNPKAVKRFIRTVKKSKYVILENDFNRSFVQEYNKNILTITGPIDTNRYSLSNKNEDNGRIVIGWIGSQDSFDYLNPLLDIFRNLSRKHKNLNIEVIGAKKVDVGEFNLIVKDWQFETEVSDLHRFDIGIMPLPDDEWSKGKGGYKLLQYMSVGIPCVASSVGINQKIIREGLNGFLATENKEWEEKLSKLIENPQLRRKMGINGREIAVKEYSVEANARRFIAMLRKVKSGL